MRVNVGHLARLVHLGDVAHLARAARVAILVSAGALAACASDSEPATNDVAAAEDPLAAKADDHWFYGGPLPALQTPSATVSLAGHTVRVTGYLPAGSAVPSMPHVRATNAGGRVQVDLVYPIATARTGKSNSRPGAYTMAQAKPYRPHGPAFTRDEGWHDVPWGGFPFLAYDGGIAFHGPITDRDNKSSNDEDVWYLERGQVSGGCNRMMGEHVVELAHVMGVDMRRVYEPNTFVRVATAPKVRVIADYDTFGGKFIDVDYPTSTGATRPAKVHGAERVEMFGSWLASETPDGKDLPPDMKWQGGVNGAWYSFGEHVIPNMVCSVPKADLRALKTFASRRGGSLPPSFCAKKECVVSELRAGRDASVCRL